MSRRHFCSVNLLNDNSFHHKLNYTTDLFNRDMRVKHLLGTIHLRRQQILLDF